MTESKLKEWIIGRIKHQDLFTRKLKNITEKEEKILVDYIDKKATVQILVELDAKKMYKDDNLEIITLNTNKNLSALIKDWNKFSKNKNLKIFFVNPKLQHDNFWILKPYVHNMITDKNSLRQGLKALFSTVESF
jgi:hypothetical protein